MPHVRKLVGTKTFLSALSPEDAEVLYGWHNDLEIIFLAQGPALRTPGTLQEFREFIETSHKKRWPIFMIVDRETDQAIGWCSLWNARMAQRRANVAILIGERDHLGRGYGSDALRLLLDHGFNLMNLNSVELETDEHNARAIHCYEKVGFRRVGVQRQARLHGQRKTDAVVMDILAEEFESPVVVPMMERAMEPD